MSDVQEPQMSPERAIYHYLRSQEPYLIDQSESHYNITFLTKGLPTS